MGIRTAGLLALVAIAWLGIFTPSVAVVRARAGEQDGTPEARQKAEILIEKQFPVLRTEGMPRLVPIPDAALSRAFPQHRFFALIFRQYPVARVAPAPLRAQNVFAVKQDGMVQHLRDTQALEEFFRKTLGRVRAAASARDSAEAWLRLTEEFKQDGFFRFAIPQDSLVAAPSPGGWRASGKAVVTQGGKGEIRATLTFTQAGNLTRVVERSTVKAGVRPICQASKLLDPDLGGAPDGGEGHPGSGPGCQGVPGRGASQGFAGVATGD